MAGFQDAHAGQDILQTMKQYLSLTEIMEPKWNFNGLNELSVSPPNSYSFHLGLITDNVQLFILQKVTLVIIMAA